METSFSTSQVTSPLESEATSMNESTDLNTKEVVSPSREHSTPAHVVTSETPKSKKSSVDRGRVQSAIDVAHKQAIAARVQREYLTWRRCCTCSITFGLISSVLAILSLTPSWFTFKNYTLYLWSAPVPLVGSFSGDGIYPIAVIGIIFDVLGTLVPLYLRIRVLYGYKPPNQLNLDAREDDEENNEEAKEAFAKFAASSVYFTKIALSLRFLSFILMIFVIAAMESRYRTGWTTKEEGWRRMVASICMSVIASICLLPLTSLSLYGPDVMLLPQNVLLKEDEEASVKSSSSQPKPFPIESASSESMEEIDNDISISIGSTPSKPSAMRRPDHLSLHQNRPSTAEHIPPPTLIISPDSHNFEDGQNSNEGFKENTSGRLKQVTPPPPPPPSLSPLSQSQLPHTPPASPLRNASSPYRSIPKFNRNRDSPVARRGIVVSTAASPSALSASTAGRGQDSSVIGSPSLGQDSLSSSPRSSAPVRKTFRRLATRSPSAGDKTEDAAVIE